MQLKLPGSRLHVHLSRWEEKIMVFIVGWWCTDTPPVILSFLTTSIECLALVSSWEDDSRYTSGEKWCGISAPAEGEWELVYCWVGLASVPGCDCHFDCHLTHSFTSTLTIILLDMAFGLAVPCPPVLSCDLQTLSC